MKRNGRVLGRIGARELTMEETEQVTGSIKVHTNVCSARQTTGNALGDGDGCNADMDLG